MTHVVDRLRDLVRRALLARISLELLNLLSQDRQAGRCRFWFGVVQQFSGEWFDKQLERAIRIAGPRYIPKIHVGVSIVKDFELFGGWGR